jgi:hypothetical protein
MAVHILYARKLNRKRMPEMLQLGLYNKIFPGYQRVNWLSGEKTNVSRVISTDQYPKDEDRDGP